MIRGVKFKRTKHVFYFTRHHDMVKRAVRGYVAVNRKLEYF